MGTTLPTKLPFSQLLTRWSTILNPVLKAEIVQGQLLQGQKLINGTTAVNHKLGRKLIGWIIVGIDGAATVYDQQAQNQNPQLTLTLVSNADVTVTLWVF